MKRRVAVLGATGIVGQRFVSLLADHPWFDLVMVTASEKVVGKKYTEAVKWVIEKPMPRKVEELTVEPLDVNRIVEEKIDIVFVALPKEVATTVEPELARKGLVVVSNASNMRLEPDIPLLNPEVNADHIDVVEVQRRNRGWDGFIAKVPNCTTAILTLTLKPLHDEFDIKRVVVASMQSLSGAGLTGVPSMFILDNLIPFIEGEEEKVETESRKILGTLDKDKILMNDKFKVTASCHRVMVLEGHSMAVFVELGRVVDVEEVIKALEEFKDNKIRGMGLPTAPEKPIIVRREPDRPQPRLDRMEGNGMSVVVGRVREDKVLNGVKYFALGHNTIRGAAGTGVLIAELIVKKNLV
ncbi:MAG: aspartate-semialdehyde dehydrogenase [Desulfurococcaceae archaeon]|jgi:aspartate-semialdehyde dehydrogenase|nr:aspartate-semialdehyde dehydrogenase [Desulfurococcaceae archaeon]MCC6057966.1 aspartate-semialdehyde dehydrogenase [Desulfurococcaceae archaeon]